MPEPLGKRLSREIGEAEVRAHRALLTLEIATATPKIVEAVVALQQSRVTISEAALQAINRGHIGARQVVCMGDVQRANHVVEAAVSAIPTVSSDPEPPSHMPPKETPMRTPPNVRAHIPEVKAALDALAAIAHQAIAQEM